MARARASCALSMAAVSYRVAKKAVFTRTDVTKKANVFYSLLLLRTSLLHACRVRAL